MSALPAHRVDALLGKIDAAVSSGGSGGVGVCATPPVPIPAGKAGQGDIEGGRGAETLKRADLCPAVAAGVSGNVPAVNESASLPECGSPREGSTGERVERGASKVGEEEAREATMATMSGLGPKVRRSPPKAIIGAASTVEQTNGLE